MHFLCWTTTWHKISNNTMIDLTPCPKNWTNKRILPQINNNISRNRMNEVLILNDERWTDHFGHFSKSVLLNFLSHSSPKGKIFSYCYRWLGLDWNFIYHEISSRSYLNIQSLFNQHWKKAGLKIKWKRNVEMERLDVIANRDGLNTKVGSPCRIKVKGSD